MEVGFFREKVLENPEMLQNEAERLLNTYFADAQKRDSDFVSTF
jgi:hypothetical protein